MRKNIHIPWEITVDIFSKLPVKSLCRFKCLSKLFLCLINNPQFIKTHLSQSQTKSQKLLHIDGREFYSLDLESTASSSFRHKFVALNLDFPVYTHNITMLGSCNGLVLLSILPCVEEYGCCVYNPSTRELKRIPECNREPSNADISWHSEFHGFGYDDSTDDYKYVMISITSHTREVFVYSLRSNAWKMLPDKFTILNETLLNPCGDFLNGAIHWTVRRTNESNIIEYVIVAFDLADERFKILPMPTATTTDVTSKDYLFFSGIRVLGDCIFAVCCRSNDNGNVGQQLKVWVMKEYGVKESWTRIFLPNPPSSSRKRCSSSRSLPSTRFRYRYPLCLYRNGDSDSILMASFLEELMESYMEDGTTCRKFEAVSEELLACNIKEGTCQKFECVGYKPKYFWWKPQQVYVESLVSPFKF